MTWDNRRPHKITFCFHVLQQEFHSKIYVFINPLRYLVGEKVLIIDTEDRKLRLAQGNESVYDWPLS